jgi:hypothetical protein
MRIYIYLYISAPPSAIVDRASGEGGSDRLASIVWQGNSREVLKGFPERARENLGFML